MRVVCVLGSRHKPKLEKFARGIRRQGHICVVVNKSDHDRIAQSDVIVTYGNIIFERGNRPWLHMDAGYLQRKKHFRLSLNCNQPSHYMMKINRPSDRWDKLGATLEPWKKNASGPIIVCASSRRNFRFLQLDYNKEIKKVLKTLKHQKRKVILRSKKDVSEGESLWNILERAYAVVTWSSSSAVEAIIRGVPSFALHHSAAVPVCRTSLRYIEDPLKPDRRQWAYNLAYQQWTLSEFEKGLPWSQLIGKCRH